MILIVSLVLSKWSARYALANYEGKVHLKYCRKRINVACTCSFDNLVISSVSSSEGCLSSLNRRTLSMKLLREIFSYATSIFSRRGPSGTSTRPCSMWEMKVSDHPIKVPAFRMDKFLSILIWRRTLASSVMMTRLDLF
jgi:hypothetical protein